MGKDFLGKISPPGLSNISNFGGGGEGKEKLIDLTFVLFLPRGDVPPIVHRVGRLLVTRLCSNYILVPPLLSPHIIFLPL